jgi:pilus assembly protein CpaB
MNTAASKGPFCAMKRAQLIGFSIAGAAGLLAFMLMRSMVDGPQEPTRVAVPVNVTEVLVARSDIGLGKLTKESSFRWQTWPADAVTPSFITKSSSENDVKDMYGAIARASIMAGEPVTRKKLIKAGQGGVLAAILPAGMRAISTKIKEETAAGRLILPNDRVDVILTRRLRDRRGGAHFVSDTLFSNVRVLAIGQQIDSTDDKKKSEGAAKTATLELTPQQAEQLALANSMGSISLALRSIADLDRGNGPSAGNGLKKKSSSAIRVLRYGVRSRAYGVN